MGAYVCKIDALEWGLASVRSDVHFYFVFQEEQGEGGSLGAGMRLLRQDVSLHECVATSRA